MNRPWLGSSVDYSVLLRQGWKFDTQSGNIQESTNECTKMCDKSVFLSLLPFSLSLSNQKKWTEPQKLWDMIKCINVCTVEVSEGGHRKEQKDYLKA